METLKFNNCYFVKNNNQIVDSLFTSTKTASGTYKQYKHYILLLDILGNPICYIQANGMIGNACKSGNRIFRQHGLSSMVERNFFPELKDLNYNQTVEYIGSVYNSIK
jgi:hypothetical protein